MSSQYLSVLSPFALKSPEQNCQEVVFIDCGVEDYEFLAKGVRPGVEVHLLEADAMGQMTAALTGRSDLKAVHVVSHGSPGCLYLGEDELSLGTLAVHEAALRSWFLGHANNEKPELLLYGCNVAAGDTGEEFLNQLHDFLGTGVAASTDITGHAKHEGNWELAARRGVVKAKFAFVADVRANYSHSLGWVQLGADIEGKAIYDWSGWTMALSRDGSTVAIGARFGDGNDNNVGQVRLYRLNSAGTEWVQLGNDIDSEVVSGWVGYATSLSADGSIVAIGAPLGDDSNNAGKVRLYQLNPAGTDWVQLGNDIDGEVDGDWAGESLSLSADGSTIAIGAPRNDGSDNDAGQVRLYRLNAAGTDWVQLGNDIDGEIGGDLSGESVSLSADGSTIAIGAPRNEGIGEFAAGHVRIYRLNAAGTDWIQLGSDIDGEERYGQSGFSVSLSADGSTIAIGAPSLYGSDAGQVQTYRLNAAGTDWIQLGNDIEGEAGGDWSGSSVSLSADGSILAVGEPFNDSNGNRSGQARLYRLNSAGTDWVQLGFDIEGEASGDRAGSSVSLSADGSILAVGEPFNDDEGNGGQVRLYRFDPDANIAPSFTADAALAAINEDDPNPTGDTVANLFSGLFSDPNNDSLSGIAVVGNSADAVTAGAWQYSTDNGNTWFDIGSIDDDANALVLDTATSLRFTPVLNYNGTPPALSIRALDSTYSGDFTSGETRETVDASRNGRATAIAGAAVSITTSVTAVNDAPEGALGYSWVQLGADIDGEASGDRSGSALSLSADGSTVAIGAFLNDSSGSNAGHVRLYRLNPAGTDWIQLGADIDGEAVRDNSGWSVSLSADGSIVAIGEPNNDSNGTDTGQVRLYRLNPAGTDWVQLGSDINGEASDDLFGSSVSLSADGSTVAIRTPRSDGNGSATQVRLYRLNPAGTDWVQMSANLDGEAGGAQSSESLSLSADGSTVAIGAPFNDANGSNNGQVRLYRLNPAGTDWVQLGADINGEGGGRSGESVSLSADGSTVAIGARFNSDNGQYSGRVRLYRLDSAGTDWVQLGADLNGEASGDLFGSSVSLSADGSTVVIGALGDDDNGLEAGQVRLYRLNPTGTDWVRLGAEINGEGGGRSGASVSLSADASTVAIGSPYINGNGPDAGQVRLYRFNEAALSVGVTENRAIIPDVSALSDVDGLGDLSYQWQDSRDGNNFTDIDGATSSTFTPGDAQVGKQLRYQVTYTDSDGTVETVTSSATGPVAKLNEAPSFESVIPSTISLSRDGTSTVEFTIGDTDNAITDLEVTAASNNGELLPNASLSLSGTGDRRTLTIVPPDNLSNAAQSGIITLSLSDGEATVSQDIEVTLPVQKTIRDFNRDGTSEILWRNQGNSSILIWQMQNNSVVGTSAFTASIPDAPWKIAGTTDFDGDGQIDLIGRNQETNAIKLWLLDENQGLKSELDVTGVNLPGREWQIVGIDDFNGDEKADILWRHQTWGQLLTWHLIDEQSIEFASGAWFDLSLIELGTEGVLPDLNWQVQATGDFDDNGTADIVWQHKTTGQISIWRMNEHLVLTGVYSLEGAKDAEGNPDNNWQIVGSGDYDGNGKSDLFWQHEITSETAIWSLDKGQFIGSGALGPVSLDEWKHLA